MTKKTLPTLPKWPSKYAARVAGMTDSPIRELLKRAGDPEIVSFAGGLPEPETFPASAFQEAFNAILWGLPVTENFPTKKYEEMMATLLKNKKMTRSVVDTSLQYGQTAGYQPLREYLAKKVCSFGVPAEAANIFLTSGSQQALALIGQLFVEKGTMILTESPTYLGIFQAWDSYGAKYCTVPMDNNGMVVEELPAVIEKYHPKFLYTVPNFHNPAGVCMSFERRKKLVEIARKYDLFIVEDDPYGDVRFEGEHIPTILSLAPERTLYLCTFSKTLAPGARVGWTVAPKEVVLRLDQAKQGADLFSSTILQMAVHHILESGMFPEHIQKIGILYKERRDIMLSAIEKYFPEGVTWTRPEGGLFLWVTVPKKINVPKFTDIVLQDEKITFIPGSFFYPHKTPESLRTMRLNFSLCKPEVIEGGIKRLGNALKKQLEK